MGSSSEIKTKAQDVLTEYLLIYSCYHNDSTINHTKVMTKEGPQGPIYN